MGNYGARKSIVRPLLMVAVLWAAAILIAQAAFCGLPEIEGMFFQANNHYQQQQYAEAIALYEEIVRTGCRSGALFYNLGNAYYKTGQIGRAIVNYERAKKLIPHDEDLFANMQLVASTLKEKQPDDLEGWYAALVTAVRESLSARAWVTAALCFYLALFSIAVVLIFVPAARSIGIPVLTGHIIITFAVMVFAGLKIKEEESARIGVIVADAVDVRYSPSYTGSIAFTIHEGLKARMIRAEEGWSQIRLSKGKSGWIESEAIEMI